MTQKKFDHSQIEKKWQKVWQENKTYQPDLKNAKKPFYNLMMFPYPSAEGLHVGNMYAFTGADVYGRFQRMQGHDVLEPIGLDGFGIHSENYALKIGKHPREQAKVSQENFYRQLHEIGNGFAWDNKLETYDPEYYKWTQWLFVQMYKNGLAYRGKAMVNWCPKDKTVLADEQVENGVCERCKTPVERRPMEQWFFKITEYADRLLGNIEKINWPGKIKIAQRQWIGKKEGVIVHHKVKDSDIVLDTFSAYPAWLFADTFMVIAPEHPIIKDLVTDNSHKEEVEKFIEESRQITNQERQVDKFEKKGVFTGKHAIDPFSGREMPIWLANFALMDFGTGIIRCSAHDVRDYEFAQKYDISLKEVVKREDKSLPVNAHGNHGMLIDSGPFTGREINPELIQEMLNWIEKEKIGKRTVNYHLRDWLISRQRYWGPPIPMINCDKCGWSPVPEEQLPVLLPDLEEWQPKGDGRGPLENAPEDWLYTKCPKCDGRAKRETDVSDTFLDSSWYFLRYPSVTTKDKPWDDEITKKWLPVNAYIGGAEHAVLHLLYARFVWMTLKDWGFIKNVDSDEPFPFLFSHGLIVKDGAKMSKSRGNVVIPDEYIKKYGADTLRMYLMFLGAYNQGGDFRDTGIMGMRKFLERVWNLLTDEKKVTSETTKDIEVKLHQTIKDMREDVGNFQYNTAIARYMELTNIWKQDNETVSKQDALSIIKLIAPFAPHMTEELWQGFGQKESIHFQPWPNFDEKLLIQDTVIIVVQVNGKLRASLSVNSKQSTVKEEVIKLAKEDEKIKLYLDRKEVKKEIFIPGKLVNFVV